MFKKIVNWILGEDVTQKSKQEYETKIKTNNENKNQGISVNQVDKVNSEVKSVEVEPKVVVEPKESMTEYLPTKLVKEDKDLNSTEVVSVSRVKEDNIETNIKSKPVKNIAKEVEGILNNVPRAKGFKTRNHLVINGERKLYLECECGGIAQLDENKELAKCSRCETESILSQ